MKNKKKLRRRNTYTPTDTSLVRKLCGSLLNKEETLSVMNLKTRLNTPEENQVQHTGRSLKPLVYVLSKRGKPLMPCSYAKSKRMVKSGKAKVVKRFPFFVIQLNFKCENKIQPVTLGMDTGYEKVGISVTTDKKELFRIEVGLRTDVSEKLTERKTYRRNKRNKLWYREPRFLNRTSTKKEGWLAPSIQHKLDTHVRIVNMICKYLPVSKVNVEVANFDIQKIKNPNIKGMEYQQGDLYNYENIKLYLISREHNKCQLCGKESIKGNSFKIHHIIERSNGGTDKPDNLALLHEKCHIKLHKKGLKLKPNKQYKAETFMSIMRWKLIGKLKEILPTKVTYGYITKIERNKLGLDKSHTNDAFVISGGTNQERCKELLLIQKRRNNRSIQQNRSGQKISVRRQRYKIQPKDLIWIDNKMFISKGSQNLGTRVAYDNNGKNKTIRVENIDRFYNHGGFYIQTPT